jgi:protocatechuate 3,4-dioxygenase beta subunit
MDRRRFLSFSFWGALTGGIALPALLHASNRVSATPTDMEGPFYPTSRRPDEDANLRQVNGEEAEAEGPRLDLRGQLSSRDGAPLVGATLEIWQADPQGRYLHPRDPSTGERHRNFQYWGRAITDANGNYAFRTLLPGPYSGRRPHIHFKVWLNGRDVLTSQMYFTNHPENDRMSFWERMQDRTGQLIELQPHNDGHFSGDFAIVV